jgi:DnaJ-domain-containing protein 1
LNFLARRFLSLSSELRRRYALRLSAQGIVDIRAELDEGSFIPRGRILLTTHRGERRTMEISVLASRYEITFQLLLAAQNLWLLDVLRHGTREEIDEAFRSARHRDDDAWREAKRRPCPERAAATAWWSILGVSRTASTEEVLSAWKRLAITHHPDKGGSHDRMAIINDARDRALTMLAA